MSILAKTVRFDDNSMWVEPSDDFGRDFIHYRNREVLRGSLT